MRLPLIGPFFALSCFPKPDKSDTGLICGPGTHAEDGVCLVDEDTGTGADDTGTPSGDDTGAHDSDTNSDLDTDTDTASGHDTGETGSDTGGGADYDVCASGGATYTSIQDAIDAATEGDTITVGPGTYGPVQVGAWSVDVTLIGAGADDTFIDGGNDPAWAQSAGSFTLSGFTFTASVADDEGAIDVTDGSLALFDAVISGVTANADEPEPYPVAYFVHGGDDFTLDDVAVRDNDMEYSTVVIVTNATSATAHHLIIADNQGVPLCFGAATGEISNSLFMNNQSFTNSGFFNFSGSGYSLWFYNNVVAGNGYSGAHPADNAYMVIRGDMDFENNVFYGNSGFVYYDTGSFNYNDIFNDDAVCEGCTGTGNLISDPKFTDPGAEDFSLKAGFSPLIDAGNPASGYNDADGTRDDIGAYGGSLGAW